MKALFVRTVVMAAAVMLASGAVVSLAEIDVAAVRGRVLLAEEPAGAMSIADAKAKLGPTPQPVVVAGRIGGKGTSPFGKNEATFSMLEIPADDHAAKPGHKADDCPFCKKRTANSPIAAVSFAGADGKVIAVDAQKLLGVAEGQDVVVRGQGFFDPKLGIPVIQINADGLYIRKAK
ncbi:MAG: hypothetical protein ACKO40_11085 [Planctomycetaceae bacterium]